MRTTRQECLYLSGSALALTLTLMPISPAHACSPVLCAPSVFLPASGHVPGNAVEFLWQLPWNDSGTGASSAVHLYKVEDGQRTEIESEVIDGPDGFKRVRPRQPVAQDAVLVLESAAAECRNEAISSVMVTVGAAAATPTQLGSLSIGETHASTLLNIPTSKGSCRADFEVASAQLKLTLDAQAQPFADSLRHTLVIDGVERAPHAEPSPIRNRYPLGGPLDKVVYTLCKGDSDAWTEDLGAGTHRVQWLSRLPDGSELRSDEVTVELRCDAGVDELPEQSDENVEADDAAESTSTAEPKHADSCSLRPAAGATHARAWPLALAFALLGLRRRDTTR
jgi:hypothetical protein